MATYYVYPSAVGNDDGSSQTDAWTSLQRAIDGTGGTQPTTNDVVLCRADGGTDETISVAIDFDGNAGSPTAGLVRYVGVNSSWVDDGTKYVVDANSTATNCANISVGYLLLRNFRFTAATGANVDVSNANADFCVFQNTNCDNAGTHGWDVDTGAGRIIFMGCRSFDNTNDGWFGMGVGCKWALCASNGNGDFAIDTSFNDDFVISKGAFFDNGDSEPNLQIDAGCCVLDCVIDGTGSSSEIGIQNNNENNLVMGCRITNLATGIDWGSRTGIYGFNLFDGNTANVSNNTYALVVPNGSDTDSNEYDPDADDGYNDASTDDYNLKASRTYNGDGNDTVGLGVGS